MKSWTLLPLGFLLVGCINDEPDPPPYPPLDARALVGCWTAGLRNPYCTTNCFDREGRFFSSMTFTTRGKEIGEDSGHYKITANTISLSNQLKTTTGKYSSNEFLLNYTIINDTLFSVNSFPAVFQNRVHPDSFPCDLKPWTLFQKPAGWDSLIKPY